MLLYKKGDHPTMTTPVLVVHLECIYLMMLMGKHILSGLALLIKVRDVAHDIGGRRQGDQKYLNEDQRRINFRHWLLKRISLMGQVGFTCLRLPALRNYIMKGKGKLENPKHNLHLSL